MLAQERDLCEVMCRLCLNATARGFDIFEGGVEELPLVNRIMDLFQIKYEKSSLLPSCICQECLDKIEEFTEFREMLQMQKKCLQNLLTNRIQQKENYCPGLNGNPGVFIPADDVMITIIDPNEEHESSEDDFSIDSDSEFEDIEPVVAASDTISQPQLQGIKQSAQKPEAQDQLAINNSTPMDTNGSHVASDAFPKTVFLCQYCDMAFTTQSGCTDHEKHHDPTTPYVCNFCPVRSTTRPALISHIKATHDGERPYICGICNKGFCRRSDLKKHTIVHTGVRPFRCPVCSKGFSRNTNLTKHMRIHSSTKPHVCQRCPRSFMTQYELTQHARTHTDIKPFRCSRCQSSFWNQEKLISHEQIHVRQDALNLSSQSHTHVENFATGEGQAGSMVVPITPYAEQVQAATDDTYRHSILAAQLQQRTSPQKISSHKSRVFQCNSCGKVCYRERDFQRHQALHLDNLFTCDECGTSFSRREKLLRHKNEQHGPQYTCDMCQVTLTTPESFATHMKMHQLHQNIAMTAQAAINASSGSSVTPLDNGAPATASERVQRPNAADMSFYSQMVPTMNLGFYNET